MISRTVASNHTVCILACSLRCRFRVEGVVCVHGQAGWGRNTMRATPQSVTAKKSSVGRLAARPWGVHPRDPSSSIPCSRHHFQSRPQRIGPASDLPWWWWSLSTKQLPCFFSSRHAETGLVDSCGGGLARCADHNNNNNATTTGGGIHRNRRQQGGKGI